jgi:hypothetical protein
VGHSQGGAASAMACENRVVKSQNIKGILSEYTYFIYVDIILFIVFFFFFFFFHSQVY